MNYLVKYYIGTDEWNKAIEMVEFVESVEESTPALIPALRHLLATKYHAMMNKDPAKVLNDLENFRYGICVEAVVTPEEMKSMFPEIPRNDPQKNFETSILNHPDLKDRIDFYRLYEETIRNDKEFVGQSPWLRFESLITEYSRVLYLEKGQKYVRGSVMDVVMIQYLSRALSTISGQLREEYRGFGLAGLFLKNVVDVTENGERQVQIPIQHPQGEFILKLKY